MDSWTERWIARWIDVISSFTVHRACVWIRGASWTRVACEMKRVIHLLSFYRSISSGVENMHEMLPLTHGRRVAIQMWSTSKWKPAPGGFGPFALQHIPPALDRARGRPPASASQLADVFWPYPSYFPHRFACEGQQPGWARAQREAFAAAHGYGGPDESVAAPAVVPPQSRHMREARAWPYNSAALRP